MAKKQPHYERLIRRMDQAFDEEFFLEVTWIGYAIIEDRLLSLLSNSGGIPQDKKGATIKMLGPKLGALEKRLKASQELRAVLYDDLVKKLRAWAQLRNDLMHTLASEKFANKANLEPDLKQCASDCRTLTCELCSRARRLKKRAK